MQDPALKSHTSKLVGLGLVLLGGGALYYSQGHSSPAPDLSEASTEQVALVNVTATTDTSPDYQFFASPQAAYTVPHDLPAPATDPADLTAQRTALATFAWREFIALNWPSSYTPAPPNIRGKPDTTKSLADFAQPNSKGELVWQTYKHRVEVYPENASYDATAQMAVNYTTDFDAVPSYVYSQNGITPNTQDPTTPIYRCDAYQPDTGMWDVDTSVDLSSVTLFNNLDETSEIDLATMFTDGDPDDPGTAPSGDKYYNYSGLATQSRRFIYEAKANSIMFGLVGDLKLYDKGLRKTAQHITHSAVRNDDQGGVAPCPVVDNLICFPPGVTSTDNIGTILVKATWRQLTATETSSGRFLIAPIIRYRNPDPADVHTFCFETVEATASDSSLPYGLIGLHIIHKTTNYPTFVFATFEQVDTLNSGTPDSSLFYYNRIGGPASGPLKQTVTSRAHPIISETNAVTENVHFQLRTFLAKTPEQSQDSVWLYYKLIGVQGAVTNPSNTDGTDYFLANLVTETNEILRSFSGSLDADEGTINPKNTNIRQATHAYTGGGCKGCHGNAQIGPNQEPGTPKLDPDSLIASDFSFITQQAPFGGIPDAINQPLAKEN